MRLLKKYRRWKQRDFLKWRDELSDYERDLFLPEIKGRCESLLTYCREIDTYCKDRRHEHNLGVILRNLGLNDLDIKNIPSQDLPQNPADLAREFFDSIQEVNEKTFVEPLERILKKIQPEVALKEFGTILTEVNLLCSIVVQAKDVLFLYRLNSIAYVRDAQTNQVIPTQPRELQILLLQFKSSMDNIYAVADSTATSIQQWHKEQMQWKTEFLKVISERIAQRNILLTIVVAVSVFFFFMTATQPLEKYQLGRESAILKNQVTEILDQKQSLAEQVKALELKVEKLSKPLLNTENDSPRGVE